jgi:hypothetical protein
MDPDAFVGQQRVAHAKHDRPLRHRSPSLTDDRDMVNGCGDRDLTDVKTRFGFALSIRRKAREAD